jgi:hypothetical protein
MQVLADTTMRSSEEILRKWVSNVFMAKGHTVYCGLVHGPYAYISQHGIYNCLNYCVIFIVHASFASVAVGCIIQAGGPQGNPCFDIMNVLGQPKVLQRPGKCRKNRYVYQPRT